MLHLSIKEPLPIAQGKTFFVCPLDKANMNSPEFFSYAGIVAQNMELNGFKLAGKDSKVLADYAVMLGYGIGSGTPMTYSVPMYGQTGGGTAFHNGSFNANTMSYSTGNQYNTSGSYSGYSYSAPQYGVVGSDTETEMEYERFVVMTIVDMHKTTSDHLEVVYETRVKSSGSSSELAVVMPTLIKAMFQNFPGVSGKTKRITLRM